MLDKAHIWAALSLLVTFPLVAGLISILIPLKFLRIRSRPQAGMVVLVSTIALIVVIGFGGPDETDAVTGATAQAQSTTTTTTSTAGQPPGPAMPKDEAKFIAVIAETQGAFRNAPNDMARGAVRSQRRAALCDLFRASRNVSGWIGAFTHQAASNDGRGVIGVTLARGLDLSTSNNSFSDHETNTLIVPGTPLHAVAVNLKIGAKVIFFGTFFADADDCVKEQSVTLSGSLSDPSFLFRFSAIRGY